MSEMDWKWFYLCMVELALFVVAGFAALHYRGLWINEKRLRSEPAGKETK